MPASIFKDKTVLITGGSSGIGLDLARLFIQDGSRVVLVARDAKKLEQAARELQSGSGREVLSLAKDLSQPGACVDIFRELSAKKINVDVLVNNAAFGMYGKFHLADSDKILQMVDTNVRALVELTRLFVPPMVERKFGKVLNVASTAAFQPIPIEALYAATKSFVLHFSEGITNELKGTGVGVTCLCPGPTETPFFSRGEIFPSKMMKRQMMTSGEVAEIGFRALVRNKSVVVAGLKNKILSLGVRVVPRDCIAQIARKVVE